MLKEANREMRKFVDREAKLFNERFKNCKMQGRYVFDTKHGKKRWCYRKDKE
jgi:hypothetical protein